MFSIYLDNTSIVLYALWRCDVFFASEPRNVGIKRSCSRVSFYVSVYVCVFVFFARAERNSKTDGKQSRIFDAFFLNVNIILMNKVFLFLFSGCLMVCSTSAEKNPGTNNNNVLSLTCATFDSRNGCENRYVI